MDEMTRSLSEAADRRRREFERLYGPLGGARLVETAEGAAVSLSDGGTTNGGIMDNDSMAELISQRVERNERWGRPTDRDGALAELVNEGQVAMWEQRAPIQPRTAALADGEDFEAEVARLMGGGMSRDRAIEQLANSGAIAF